MILIASGATPPAFAYCYPVSFYVHSMIAGVRKECVLLTATLGPEDLAFLLSQDFQHIRKEELRFSVSAGATF